MCFPAANASADKWAMEIVPGGYQHAIVRTITDELIGIFRAILKSKPVMGCFGAYSLGSANSLERYELMSFESGEQNGFGKVSRTDDAKCGTRAGKGHHLLCYRSFWFFPLAVISQQNAQ